ncbi:hypothetical protein [Rhodoferax sp. TS-BS-61-7]|uniref:hypothetical protein n=1 Tax=Rhodoferax sp. TS-BS-61-7 TaxID=2094194 RepID=UPI000CF73095|nr:hypothetical protein [Rhodoferax sp. TS-BS-61-7]PQA78079.1 hypothetical protein C5F53_07020 [Rhodoferax sp. TS-BS-61-7]
MARPIATLKPEGIEPALVYLKRALERSTDSFHLNPAAAKQSLLQLTERLSTCYPEIRALVFKDWVTVNLTDKGRIKMLSAVRQQRVSAKKRKVTHRSLRLPIQTAKDLESLAKQAGGMPVTKLLAAFTAMGSADAKLREKLIRLAIAINMK